MHVPEFDPNTATRQELIVEVLRLRADLAIAAADLVIQARDREWCDDYNSWVRTMNRRMHRPHFIERVFDDDDEWDHDLDETGRFGNPNDPHCEVCRESLSRHLVMVIGEPPGRLPKASFPHQQWHGVYCTNRYPNVEVTQ